MWLQATSFAVPEKLTAAGEAVDAGRAARLETEPGDHGAHAGATELAAGAAGVGRRSSRRAIWDVLTGAAPYGGGGSGRDSAVAAAARPLRRGQTVTKLRKVFLRARWGRTWCSTGAAGRCGADDMEYEYILPNEPSVVVCRIMKSWQWSGSSG